ncbi:MAG: cell division protein FtsA [Minisyncoccia bacterium]
MNEIATGIDVGTHRVKVVIAEAPDDVRMPPRILGTGYAKSQGVKRGWIVSPEDAARSIAAAARQAAKAANVKKVRRAFVSVGGEGLHELLSRAESVVERGDSEITARDIERVGAASEAALSPAMLQNRRILHNIALRYSLDGVRFLGKNPVGVKAARLGVESIFFAAQKKHVDDLGEALGIAGIEAEDVVAAPLAASFVALTKPQKRVGAALLDIGAETSTLIVFEDELPVSTIVFPLGADDVAADLALALKIPLEEAVELARGAVIGASYSQRKVDETVDKRLAIIFRAVEGHLKKLEKNGLLPAGIQLVGGGSQLGPAPAVAQKILKLPARAAPLSLGESGRGQLNDGSWAVAYGLTVWGLNNKEEYELADRGVTRELFGGVWRFVKKFLP